MSKCVCSNSFLPSYKHTPTDTHTHTHSLPSHLRRSNMNYKVLLVALAVGSVMRVFREGVWVLGL